MIPATNIRVKVGFLTGLVLLFSFLLPVNGWAQDYLAEISDFPIMTGLVEMAEARVVFDTPDGRIVTALLEGPVDIEEVRNFYLASLGELGWSLTLKSEDQAIYRFDREREVLTLRYLAGRGLLTLEVELRPRPESES